MGLLDEGITDFTDLCMALSKIGHGFELLLLGSLEGF